MKNKLTFVLSTLTVIALYTVQHTYAQTGNWKLAGNNLAGTEKLGSKNSFPLSIVTNNVERMSIDPAGDITMGANSGPLNFLFFGTSFHMKFPQDQYIFRHSNSQEGLFRNQTLQRIEYRDPVSVPNMWVQSSSTGNSYFRGNMGIGTETPEGKLHVFRASAGIVTANANAPLVVENSTSNYINLLTPSGSESGILFGNNLNAQDGAIIYNNINLLDGLQFRTNGNNTRMSLTSTGNLGIGTPAPEANLHVFRGSAGTVTANSNAPLVVENSTSNYINLITPDANERGVLFGDNLNVQDGGIIYNGANQLQLRGNGNLNRVIIDPDGNTGINLDPTNTTSFNDAMLQVRSDGDDNLRLVAADNTNDWSMYSQDGDLGVLSLYKNGSFRGSFNATTGVYSPISDGRLKKDVATMPEIIEKLMKLQPKQYHFKEDGAAKKFSYGFIAQEVSEIFPEFVTLVKDRKTGQDIFTLNYDNFGVLAVKAIQELQKQVEELKQTVNKLSQGSSSINAASANSKTDVTLNNTALEQNNPNPFTTSTVIRYNIPAGARSAQLVITNLSGNVIKRIPLNANGAGTVNVDASALINGTYSYTLMVDGKIISDKKMVVSH